MAAATATDSTLQQDRRLAISKASAKISKSASLKKPASSAAPPRPVATIVNTDPSSFRRVVQELTGSPCASPDPPSSRLHPTPAPPSEPRPSRLQRIAPPPLLPELRSSQPQNSNQQHQQLLLQQQHRLLQQKQQQQAKLMVAPPFMASLSPSSQHNPLSPLLQPPFLTASATNHSAASVSTLPSPGAQFTIPSLPMLPPHLLSPLPALTPGDNTWASPLDVIPPAPLSLVAPNQLSVNRDSSARIVAGDHRASAPPTQLGPFPPHLPLSLSPARLSWNPSLSWSPRFAPSSLPPISPSFFPPSPGFGFGNMFGNLAPNGVATNFGTPNGMPFQGSCDNGFFKPA